MMVPKLAAWPMFELKSMLRTRAYFEGRNTYLQYVEETLTPWYSILGLMESYDFLINYIKDKNNAPPEKEDPSFNKQKRYVALFKHFDPSEEHLLYRKVIDTMMENEEEIPIIPTKDYGAWTTRMFKAIASRTRNKAYIEPTNNEQEAIFRGFMEPHSYDTENISLNHYPNTSIDARYFVYDITDKLVDFSDDFSEEIKSHPIYKVAENMHSENRTKPTYVAFAEAAGIMDEQYNNPRLSWNCLVNASYYAGKHKTGPEKHQIIAKQALYLAEREGWGDAAIVLKRHLKTYQEMMNT